jgi:hypothetical protein
MEKTKQTAKGNRLEGLDLARYVAFVGMVVVNFKIAMGAEGGEGLRRTACREWRRSGSRRSMMARKRPEASRGMMLQAAQTTATGGLRTLAAHCSFTRRIVCHIDTALQKHLFVLTQVNDRLP